LVVITEYVPGEFTSIDWVVSFVDHKYELLVLDVSVIDEPIQKEALLAGLIVGVGLGLIIIC